MPSLFLLIPWFKLEPWPIHIPVIDKTLELQPFGLLVALGIVLGSRVAEWYGEKQHGVPRQYTADFLVYTIVIGLLSAMVLNMVFYEPEKIVAMFKGKLSYPGLSSYGGFIGGIGAALWFRQKKRMSILVMGDIWCFAFPFAWLFGRTGCFVVHDHPGKVSDFLLAVDNYNLQGQPRHDLGLYEVLWSAFAIVLFLILGRQKRKAGFFMALLPLIYAPIRFFLDYLRETPASGGDVRYAGFTPGQYASLAFTVVGIVVAMRVARGKAQGMWLDGAPVQGAAGEATGEKSAAPASGMAAAKARKK